MHTDYNITPIKSIGGEPDARVQQAARCCGSAQGGPKFIGAVCVDRRKALERTATVGTPMPLEIWADDDALYSTGGNGPMGDARPILVPLVAKYRGPGDVTLGTNDQVALRNGQGRQAARAVQRQRGHAPSTSAQPGDYIAARQRQRLLRQRRRRLRLLLDDGADEGEGRTVELRIENLELRSSD